MVKLSSSARLEAVRLSRFHYKLAAVTAAGRLFEGVDLAVIFFAIPILARLWRLNPEFIGLILSAAVIGILVGDIVWGMIADRIGRRRAFMGVVGMFACFSGLSALSWNFESLFLMRFLTGIGIGGGFAVDSAVLSEFIPARYRGRFVGVMPGVVSGGQTAIAFIAAFLAPSLGWQSLFLVGAIPLAIIFWIRRYVPESPRYLESRSRFDEALRVVESIEKRSGISAKGGRPTTGNTPPASSTWSPARELVSKEFVGRTSLTWILSAVISYGFFGLFSWIPTLLVRQGFSFAASFFASGLIFGLQVPGAFLAAWLADIIGRKRTLAAYLIIEGFILLLFPAAPSDIVVVSVAAAASFFQVGQFSVLLGYLNEIYPTRMRATGVGWGLGVGRLGGIAGPSIVGLLLAAGYLPAIFWSLTAAMIVSALLMLRFGMETKAKTLEELAR